MLLSMLLALAIQAPNDPYFPAQFGLQLMQVPAAWEITTGSAAIEMAQFDTGVVAHEDLTENVVLDGLPIYSAFGTWAAGIVCADTDNGLGIAGVCPHLTFNVYATIWSEEHLAESFALAEATSAKIGVTGYALAGWHARHEFDLSLDDWSANGTRILICPAGEGGQRIRGPNDARLLVVGACALDGAAEAYSNTGKAVDLWAPGHATFTDISGGYAASDSTKIAAANVAGVAALVASVNPALTGAEIQSILLATATPMACGPVVNALAAVEAAQP